MLGPRRTQPAQRGSSCHLAVHVEGSSHGSIAHFFLPLIPILSYACIQSPAAGHLGHSRGVAVVKEAAGSLCVQVFVWTVFGSFG